ncbi:MAG: DUF4915 domain-containing protein [Candidatus Paceibacterota bacterium]
MLHKTSFIDINKKNRRPIVLFGSGNIAKKTIRKIGKENIAFIVDNSLNLQGTSFKGLQVNKPEELSEKYFVVICSTAISAISAQLQQMSFIENDDFTISPVLNDLLAIEELENLQSTFYFTSGSVPQEGKLQGGGLYKCKVDGVNIKLEKVYSGPCYGALRKGESIIFVDTDHGLFRYKKNKIEHLCELPTGSRAHGISFNSSNERYYVTCSYLDAALELNSEFEIKRRFELSDKIKYNDEPMHHCNDNLAIGNSLYVSMFSSTGSWKADVFDGCIAEFDIKTGKRLDDIYKDLYMPHNIKKFDGSLHILDSLPGHLKFNNMSIQGTFPAFTRGLDYKNGLYYIGQSKNRNYSKVMGLSNNISIDCGVVVFNPELKVSRFLQFPYTIGEIHSIVVI